jgi:hypothetical protein
MGAATPRPIGEPAWQEGEVKEIPGDPDGKSERIIINYKSPARLLSREGEWFRCTVARSPRGYSLWIEDIEQPIVGGMSGSPIVTDSGAAVGLICTTTGPHPRLLDNLPGWISQQLLSRNHDP